MHRSSFPLRVRTLAVASLIFATAAIAAVPLAENGAARADVVVAASATVDERSAAEELVRYLKQATGADLPVRAQRERGRPAVLIGTSAAPDALKARLARLGRDGFVVDTTGDTIVLAGNGYDGTRFAVYEFLEQVAGIRWLWPGEVGEVVPRVATLRAPDMAMAKEPAFVWRFLGPGGALWGPHDK